jgi:hypothetical protein
MLAEFFERLFPGDFHCTEVALDLSELQVTLQPIPLYLLILIITLTLYPIP